MQTPASEKQNVATLVRERADHCLEVSRRSPHYAVYHTPSELWAAIADALSSVADELEAESKADRS